MHLYSSFFVLIFLLNLVKGIKSKYESQEEPLPLKRPRFDLEEEVVRLPKHPRIDTDEELPPPIGIRPKPILIDPREELPLPMDILEEYMYSPAFLSQSHPYWHCSPLYSQQFHSMINFKHKPTTALNFPRQIPKWLREQSRARRAYQTQKKKMTIAELLMKEGIIKPPTEEKYTSKITDKVKDMYTNKMHFIKDKISKKKKKSEAEKPIEMESKEEEYDDEELDDSFWDSDEDDDSDEVSSDANTNYNYNVNTIMARRKLPSKTKGKKRNLYKKKKVG
ncbi:protein TIC 100-like isoform X3 [Nasonia vitripennis]|uniref:Uncharacterized protein n=1 Tax=Nasonia vitripennis TaxID=7425 RepID=A0A7M7GGD4_NASVI|nr:protein TIC 100-like isoform X3 [Nasonia vitripennis]